jgi:transposase-like protein
MSPNGMERLNEEIRLRERVIRMFPTRESIIRLIEALLMEINKKG